MCNCGKKREDHRSGQSAVQNGYRNTEPVSQKAWDDVYFEYTGLTALSVTGKISGKHYRFSHPGNMQRVDYRDVSGMMAVPVLQKVRRQ